MSVVFGWGRAMAAWGLVFGLGLAACSTTTRIQINSFETTNDGRSFYVMVRQIEEEEIIADSYEDAARRVFAREADTDNRQRRVVIPGKPLTLDMPTEKNRDIVLYFFFTEPGDRWWLSINKERLPGEVVVDLGLNEVERVGVRQR